MYAWQPGPGEDANAGDLDLMLWVGEGVTGVPAWEVTHFVSTWSYRDGPDTIETVVGTGQAPTFVEARWRAERCAARWHIKADLIEAELDAAELAMERAYGDD